MLVRIDAGLLQKSLGAMLLVYVVTNRFNLVPPIPVAMPVLVASSAAYGFFSGLLGTGNIVKVVVLKQMQLSKEGFVGAMAATSVLANMIKLFVYGRGDVLDRTQLPMMTILVASAIVAAMIGRKLIGKLSVRGFENGLMLVLTVSAIGMLL